MCDATDATNIILSTRGEYNIKTLDFDAVFVHYLDFGFISFRHLSSETRLMIEKRKNTDVNDPMTRGKIAKNLPSPAELSQIAG